MTRTSLRLPAKFMLVLVGFAVLTINPVAATRSAEAATTATSTPLVDGNFELGPAQSAWTESQNSGGELIDTIDPHTGTWAADLCDIDNCADGHGGAGDALIQGFVAPGQVTSAQLSFSYNLATSQPDNNVHCSDWLTVGLGIGKAMDASATKRYCTPTGARYVNDTIDVTSFLKTYGGQAVDAQMEGFTDNLYPSQFFVDDISLSITYLITPSAPAVAAIADCSIGQTTLAWSAPWFPLGTQWPVQSYTVTPYNVNGIAQQTTTVPGTQTSLPVNLNGGSVCYFTVTATNANGTGPAGAPTVPVTAVTPLSTPTSTGYTLQWTLQPSSAAAASYRVFSRDGSGPWLTWGDTTTTSSTVYGVPGHTYHYYVQGFNAAGSGPSPSGNGQAGVTVPLTVAHAMLFNALYGVDAYGALHPADSPPLPQPTPWTWQIARGIALRSTGAGGYILDGWGGVHPFGDAPAVSFPSYWPGWDITRGIGLRPDGVSGYVVDAFGGVHPFGGAPAVANTAYWPGQDIVRGIVVDPTGLGGYVLDGWGGVHAFGDAAPVRSAPLWPGWDIARGIALRHDNTGGYIVDAFGGVHPFGTGAPLNVSAYWPGWDIARGIVLLPDGSGGYVLDGFGNFNGFGSVTGRPGTPNYAGANVMRGLGAA